MFLNHFKLAFTCITETNLHSKSLHESYSSFFKKKYLSLAQTPVTPSGSLHDVLIRVAITATSVSLQRSGNRGTFEFAALGFELDDGGEVDSTGVPILTRLVTFGEGVAPLPVVVSTSESRVRVESIFLFSGTWMR